LVLGSILAFVALGTGIASAALVAADVSARDADGFLMSPAQPLSTSTYAIASSRVQINIDPATSTIPETLLGDAKLTVTNENSKDVFIGIAPTARVRAYLAGVEHVTLVDLAGSDPVYRTTDGSAPPAAPERLDWVVQSSGSGRQEITWPVENGDWTVVVMNADASPGVTVGATAGAEVPALHWLIGILLIIAAITLMASILLIVVPVRAAGRGSVPA